MNNLQDTFTLNLELFLTPRPPSAVVTRILSPPPPDWVKLLSDWLHFTRASRVKPLRRLIFRGWKVTVMF